LSKCKCAYYTIFQPFLLLTVDFWLDYAKNQTYKVSQTKNGAAHLGGTVFGKGELPERGKELDCKLIGLYGSILHYKNEQILLMR